MGYNYGGDMFLSYSSRYQDYNNITTQGLENIVECFGTRLSYMIFPKTNSKVLLSCDFRSRNIQSNINNDLFIRFGISSSLWNAYADY